MILNQFKLPDEVYERYQAEAKERQMSVGDVLRERLLLAEDLDPREKPLILFGGATMQAIESYLGGGQLKSATDLLSKVSKLAAVGFGRHDFVLSAIQAQELMHRAKKLGLTTEQLLDRMWIKISEDFFKYVP